jgi:alkylation response protein AidB-like acyl-CoA dehydrogenase
VTPVGGQSFDDMNLLSDDDFRGAVRRFVEANYPPQLRNQTRRLHWSENRVWYMALSAKGWLAPSWPREHGGMGLAAAKQLIMIEEFERHGCARISDMGPAMLGPLLIQHGSESQKAHFLPKILSGDHIWCQGYSEPNAGSDLAAVATTATLDGDSWVINGQKTWTTLANDANWIFVLARTDRQAKKQEGISFLLAPMDAPGITVRPIINLDLFDEFSEVFFDNVRIPADHLVGAVNQGWTITKAQLGFERVHIGSPRLSAYALARLRQIAERAGVWDDPAFRDRYVALEFDLADHKALYEIYAGRLKRGEPLGHDVSLLKLNQSELFQRIADFMLEIAGDEAGLLEPPEGDRALHAAGLFLLARPTTIFGGTSEILRNVISRNVLNLPN